MKWNEESIIRLKSLIEEGKGFKEISIILNRTKKSVSVKSFNLGLQIIPKKVTKDFVCKNCGKVFNFYLSSNRLFCSSSCSASFNNKKRYKTKETKDKIRKSVKEYHSKHKKQSVKKSDKIKKCKSCGLVIEEKFLRICKDCHVKYYKYYRPLCEFNFEYKKYIGIFDSELVDEYGWYSPSNKGNNLNGVSMDHMYSVKDGFKNGVDPYFISHPANCQLLKHTQNNLKNKKSIITLDELYLRVNTWDKKWKESKRKWM